MRFSQLCKNCKEWYINEYCNCCDERGVNYKYACIANCKECFTKINPTIRQIKNSFGLTTYPSPVNDRLIYYKRIDFCNKCLLKIIKDGG